jgi:DNA repair exonuclease SbcCD ATPase subunit
MADTDQSYKIQIVFDLLNQGKVEEAKAKLTDLNQEAAESAKKNTSATEEDAGASKKSAQEVEDLGIKKRELLESTRALTREMPVLGEIMRAVYNPMAFTIFGIIGAFEIWINKIKALTEAFGGIVLPDLTSGITQANDIATAYDGITKAVKGADDEFNNAAAAFERQEKAIAAQLAAMRQLITAQKEKAIADLDLERSSGKITPASYAAKKSIIEQGYNDKTTQAEIDARNADLAAKKQEVAQAEADAKTAQSKAAGFKLPDTDDQVQSQIDAFKKLAAENRTQADAATAEAKKQQDLIESGQGSLRERAESFPELLGQTVKYGGDYTPQNIRDIETQTAKEAEDRAAAADAAAARIEEQKKQRDDARKDAEDKTKAAEKAKLSIAGEDDPTKVGSVAWQNAQAAQAQSVRDSSAQENRFVGDADAFHRDIVTVNKDVKKPTPENFAAAKQAVNDMVAAIQDSADIISHFSGSASQIAEMKRQLEKMRGELDQAQRQIAQVSRGP